MYSAILLAIILITGYLYINQTERERYKFKRLSGWHCYFYVAAWGLLFFCISWCISSFLNYLAPGNLRTLARHLESYTPTHCAEQACQNSINIKSLLFCIIALLLPFIWCKIIRPLAYKINDKAHSIWTRFPFNSKHIIMAESFTKQRQEKALLAAVENNPFERILTEANLNSSLLMFSLDSRKFYIGRIAQMPAFSNGKIEYLKFIPLFSGYRDKDTLKTINSTDYTSIFTDEDSLTANYKIISADNIEDISFFKADVYEQFQHQSTKTEPDYPWPH